MAKITLAALVLMGLGACATPEAVRVQAANNCQSVGISEKDPQFATCREAFSRQYLEDRLDRSYHDALNATADDRRIAHQWYGF